MRIALPIWDRRVSPVVDVAQTLLVIETGSPGKRRQQRWRLKQSGAAVRAQTLVEAGVEVLICGAISQLLRHLLEGHGITVISHVRGEADAVLEAYLQGRLDEPRFAMPGCEVHVDSGMATKKQPQRSENNQA